MATYRIMLRGASQPYDVQASYEGEALEILAVRLRGTPHVIRQDEWVRRYDNYMDLGFDEFGAQRLMDSQWHATSKGDYLDIEDATIALYDPSRQTVPRPIAPEPRGPQPRDRFGRYRKGGVKGYVSSNLRPPARAQPELVKGPQPRDRFGRYRKEGVKGYVSSNLKSPRKGASRGHRPGRKA